MLPSLSLFSPLSLLLPSAVRLAGLYIAVQRMCCHLTAATRIPGVPRLLSAPAGRDDHTFENFHLTSVRLTDTLAVSVVSRDRALCPRRPPPSPIARERESESEGVKYKESERKRKSVVRVISLSSITALSLRRRRSAASASSPGDSTRPQPGAMGRRYESTRHRRSGAQRGESG